MGSFVSTILRVNFLTLPASIGRSVNDLYWIELQWQDHTSIGELRDGMQRLKKK